jgi:hypothetical protein
MGRAELDLVITGIQGAFLFIEFKLAEHDQG